ncbi:hypothetical protein EI94DRAFT_1796948 [Lactarius quietus]|nr:hypothetical protein EI94DRAFT_1796948 [Lactarius quietus]
MPFKPFLRKWRHRSRPAASGDQSSAHIITVVSDPAWNVDTHDDIAMNAIQTSLAVLQTGSSLAAKLPFIVPIAGLLLQVLTMRDAREVKQCKEECEIVMHKLARIGKIIVNLCDRYNLSEEDLPASLRDILDSLQRFVSFGDCCAKGIKGFFLRKDLLTKIKQCDVELSNVLQVFQAELILDVRVSLIVVKSEAASDSCPIEASPNTPEYTKRGLDALWLITSNAKQIYLRNLNTAR